MITMTTEQDGAIILRINQLYHELTRDAFEAVHRHRFRVQGPFWEKVARTTLRQIRPAVQAGIAARSPSKPRAVVDLACGTGFVTRILGTRLTSNDRLIALDLGEAPLGTTGRSWENLRQQRRDGPALVRLAGDAQTIPLADASADLVAMNASLHHVPNPRKVLCEVDRILKPGGYFALGFEPNRPHFESTLLAGAARGLARLQWYASPRQNRRRLRTWIGRHADDRAENEPSDWTAVADAMNAQLLREGLVDQPLRPSNILDLIDPHARGNDEGNGFDPGQMLRQAMPGYQILLLLTSDYLGETARFCPAIRAITDAVLRAFAPGHGSLFSWLVRKPVGPPEVAP